VIGREEQTHSEQAQYHFLRSSLTASHNTPPFITAIWFPVDAQGIDDGIYSSSSHAAQILEKLNNSQREIVRAMLSTAPQDSLVIAHGIHTLFNCWPLTD
jgi:hypothetical protein